MFRTFRPLALAVVLAAAACTDRTSPEPPIEGPQAVREDPAPARERLARRIALALRDERFRAQLKQDLDRSPVREGKLHFQRYLASARGRARSAIARVTGETTEAITLDASRASTLELYLPVPAHRVRWTGDENILVATTDDERQAPVAFSPNGERFVLSPTTPPDVPVLALVPAETDFDRPGRQAGFLGEAGGGGSTSPAGLYMTNSHLVESFESWVKGAPEIEVHMLGQAGRSDSLSTYSCAGGAAAGYYYFDQNSLDWSGTALLMSQTQLDAYNAQHPGQAVRLFFMEDDDTSCEIRANNTDLRQLLTAVDSLVKGLAGGHSEQSATGKAFRYFAAAQKLVSVVASAIKTNDDLIGNAVEDVTTTERYTGYNWIIKGQNGRTNGYVKLEMR